MSPRNDELFGLSSILKSLEEKIWSTVDSPSTKKEKEMESNLLLDNFKSEMDKLSGGRDIKFIGLEDGDEKVNLTFELVGLTSDEIKISITETNFLEMECLQEKTEEQGNSFIWAYPLGQGFKKDEMTQHFTGDNKLVVSVPKDPDFQSVEESENENEELEESAQNEVEDWFNPLSWPFTYDLSTEDVKVIKPIESSVVEDEDQFKIEMKVEEFEPDEITVTLCDGKVLRVEGERKNPAKKD